MVIGHESNASSTLHKLKFPDLGLSWLVLQYVCPSRSMNQESQFSELLKQA